MQPILARIPREFEAAVLAPRDQREKCRHEALSHVQRLVDDTEEAGFDIDEVSEAENSRPYHRVRKRRGEIAPRPENKRQYERSPGNVHGGLSVIKNITFL